MFVIVDMCLEDGNGLDVIEWIWVKWLDLWVIVLIGYGNIVMVVIVVKLGVIDYLLKFVDLDDIVVVFV